MSDWTPKSGSYKWTDILTECKRVTNFDVFDIGSNLSDHLPLLTHCSSNIELVQMLTRPTVKDQFITRLRWDHADVTPY